MKLMMIWTPREGALQEAAKRFLAGEASPREGVKLLGRWYNVDLSGGFSLYETNDPALVFKGSARWVDLMDFQTRLVIEDSQVAQAFQELFGG